jgi:uncharacterized protein YcgI (DUF1989 family)
MTAPQRPEPIYPTGILPRRYTDTAMYEAIGEATGRRALVEEFTIPIRTGKAWRVEAGQVCRVSTPEGPQVGDFNFWNAENPRERFWAARTRQIQGTHVTTGDRLWSCLPYLRPMLTITGDSVAYGVDEYGGGVHDLLGSRCDPHMKKLLTGMDVDDHCHTNLVNAVEPFGLDEMDVHDVLNVFQLTGLVDGKYYTGASPAKPGDHIEFLAEIPLLCALSNCRGGDLSQPRWGPSAKDTTEHCRPLHVEIFELDPALLDGWTMPEPSAYRGRHGQGTAESAG